MVPRVNTKVASGQGEWCPDRRQGESRVGGRESSVFFLCSLGGGRDMGFIGDCT